MDQRASMLQWILVGALCASMGACASTEPGDGEAPAEPTNDVTTDVAPDPDGAVDATPEEDVEPGPDVDPESDADPEPDSDPVPDVDPDPDVDPEPDVDPDPDVAPDPDVETVPDVAPDAGPEDDLGPPEPVDCDPPLFLDAETVFSLPFGLTSLQASGGTGAYSFAIVSNGSGAQLNPITGAYLAGVNLGTQDVISLTDAGCIGEAQLTMKVVAPLVAQPASAAVGPGTSFQMTVTEGSGSFACLMELAGSGGQVTESGLYTAGAEVGTDVVVCEDLETGQGVQSVYKVGASFALTAVPEIVAIPLGTVFHPTVEGGTGSFAMEVEQGTSVVLLDDALMGDLPGSSTVKLIDDYTSEETWITVEVVEPLHVALERSGDASYQAASAMPGDLNGDGFPDAVLGVAEADVQGVDGGAVYVYSGATALEDMAAPAQVISIPGRRVRFGRSLTVADFDQDGQQDLAVGASHYDGGLTDNGGLLLFRGVEGGFFEEMPYLTLVGLFGFDNLGHGVTACDVNADGWPDLIGGLRNAENRDLEVQPTNQGALYVYLGGESGFSLKADQTLYGKIPVEGAWVDEPDLKMGFRVAGGDFDGDGACDVAVSSYDYVSKPGGDDDGAVFLYRGVKKTDEASGGLAPVPSLAWAGLEGNKGSLLGRRLALGDLDGDGKDELVMAQYRDEAPGISGSNHGVVRVVKGMDLADLPVPQGFLIPSGVAWSFYGDSSGDGMGWDVHVEDADGDGHNDLVATSLSGEVAGATSNTGSVHIFKGLDGELPAAVPTRDLGGHASGDVFGVSAKVMGDLDDDGLPELFVLAGRDNTLGIDVGLPYVVRGALPDVESPADGDEEGEGDDPDEVPSWLVAQDMPGSPSGSRVASSVAVLSDLNGDGFNEVAVGSPLADSAPDNHVNRGRVTVYEGSASGVSTTPLWTLAGFQNHSNSDSFGWFVADAGDFDGDGYPDVAVVARQEDRPNNFNNSNYAPDIPCTGSANNPGAVFIFRSKEDGLVTEQPAFVWYGTNPGDNLERMAAGMDINGDGLDDFVAGGDDWDPPGASNGGGFGVVFGRFHWNDPKIDVICEPDFEFGGIAGSDRLAGSITGLGDLNGDGCDEFAVGAQTEEQGGPSNEGTVRVFFGWGGEGCPAEPSYVMIHSGMNNAQAGYSIDGGHDMDGDGIPDMVVGGFNLTVNGNRTGAAWYVSGAELASLPPEDVVPGQGPAVVHPLIPYNTGVWMLLGAVDDEEFGRAVAVVPNAVSPGIAGLLVGSPFGNQSGVVRSGGAAIFRVDADPDSETYGLDPRPLFVFGGETGRSGGRLGEQVAAGMMGDAPVVIMGGYEASGVGLDQGAAYTALLPAAD